MALTRKMKRQIGGLVILTLVVYALVLLTGNFRSHYREFVEFKWGWLPVAIVLVTVNFVLREWKWDFFRRRAGVEAPRMPSALIFFSGYSMCLSPGKVGELIKPVMYKEYLNQPLSKTIPLCFCERLTDLLGMVVVGGATFYTFVHGVRGKGIGEAGAASAGTGGGLSVNATTLLFFLIGSIVLLGAIIAVARNRRMAHGMLDFLTRISGIQFHFAGVRFRSTRLAGIAKHLRDLYDSTYSLLTAYNLTTMSLFAAFSWSFEGCATYIISRYGLGIEAVTLPHVLFIFCLASIVGGLFFFIPVGGFEAVMLACYALLGASGQVCTILTRLATAFYGVAFGVVAIVLTTRCFHKAVQWDELEQMAQQD